MANFLKLDAPQIVETVEVLTRRIEERFPQAHLKDVCQTLLRTARQAEERSRSISRPNYLVRILSTLLVVSIVATFGFAVYNLRFERLLESEQLLQATEFIQVLDAAFNALLLIGATIVFLFTLEIRLKRKRCLKAIHELRSLAHIIDMHQLTKDPERLLVRGPDTMSSPKRTMSLFELNRYLDYCSEMLSLSGKIAALYVQSFEDTEAVSAVNDLEDLTSGLSRKIWQKIMVLPDAAELERRVAEEQLSIQGSAQKESANHGQASAPRKEV